MRADAAREEVKLQQRKVEEYEREIFKAQKVTRLKFFFSSVAEKLLPE